MTEKTPKVPKTHAEMIADIKKATAQLRPSERFADGNTMGQIRINLGDGYKNIGAGCYALVFQHPISKNKVVKICCSADDPYVQYAHWTRSIRRFFSKEMARHFPKIYSVQKVNEFTVVTSEKLEVIKWQEGAKNEREKAYRKAEMTTYELARGLLKKQAKVVKASEDMHSDNVMLRRIKGSSYKTEHVITDPWCHNRGY